MFYSTVCSYRIPDFILKSALPLPEKLILSVVFSFNESDTVCFVSDDKFAQWLSCTPRHFRRCLKKLEAGGHIHLNYFDELGRSIALSPYLRAQLMNYV